MQPSFDLNMALKSLGKPTRTALSVKDRIHVCVCVCV